MASSSPNKNFVVRSAAVLTNSEVKGNNFDLNNAWGGEVSIQVDFTLGSLTNVIIKFYVSMDGSTWYDLKDYSGNNSYTVTASQTTAYAAAAMGWKFFTVGVTGTGTVTSSSIATQLHYLRRGTQN